jgi:hypothetical protein
MYFGNPGEAEDVARRIDCPFRDTARKQSMTGKYDDCTVF